jgi:chromosome segregation ATPase
MTQRTQKQIKALQNKLSNIDADIERLEKELNIESLINEKAQLENERTVFVNTVAEENNYKAKIDACSAMINNCESQKLTADFERKKAFYEEQEIYNNEKSRIDFEYYEWRMYMSDKLSKLEIMRKELTEQLEELNSQKSEVDTTIQSYHVVKRDLRLQNINRLLSQQLEYKQNKAIYNNHKETLAGLHLEKSVLEQKINDYTQLRFKINQDYYDWKNEVSALEKELKPLESISVDVEPTKKMKEKLKKRLTLAKDIRQDYKLHYMQLDNELTRNQNMLKRVNKQLAKLSAEKKERPILRLNKNTDEHGILEELQQAKNESKTLAEKIQLQNTILNNVEKEMDDIRSCISSGKRPQEILDFETRAEQRLSIMESRITQKYTDTINRLNASINDSRQTMDVYIKKYNDILAANMGKDVSSLDKSIETLNNRMERKSILDKLLTDRAQILESIIQLSTTSF